MNTKSKPWVVAGLLVVGTLGCSPSEPTLEPQEQAVEPQEQAFAKLKNLDGKVSTAPDGKVVRVWFSGGRMTDTGLEHLKGLTSLQSLGLSETQITDAGLVHQANVHDLCMQVDAAVELVQPFVESHYGPPWDRGASRTRKTLGLKYEPTFWDTSLRLRRP